ncbi:hypothetical protein [Dactylosporangium vinaceum]|nr:hypothetical protein [Dactylosporangium vinaceum]
MPIDVDQWFDLGKDGLERGFLLVNMVVVRRETYGRWLGSVLPIMKAT